MNQNLNIAMRDSFISGSQRLIKMSSTVGDTRYWIDKRAAEMILKCRTMWKV